MQKFNIKNDSLVFTTRHSRISSYKRKHVILCNTVTGPFQMFLSVHVLPHNSPLEMKIDSTGKQKQPYICFFSKQTPPRTEHILNTWIRLLGVVWNICTVLATVIHPHTYITCSKKFSVARLQWHNSPCNCVWNHKFLAVIGLKSRISRMAKIIRLRIANTEQKIEKRIFTLCSCLSQKNRDQFAKNNKHSNISYIPLVIWRISSYYIFSFTSSGGL